MQGCLLLLPPRPPCPPGFPGSTPRPCPRPPPPGQPCPIIWSHIETAVIYPLSPPPHPKLQSSEGLSGTRVLLTNI